MIFLHYHVISCLAAHTIPKPASGLIRRSLRDFMYHETFSPNAPYKEAISRLHSNQLKMARIRCLLAIITLTIATITSSYAQYAIEGIAVPDGKISHL